MAAAYRDINADSFDPAGDLLGCASAVLLLGLWEAGKLIARRRVGDVRSWRPRM
jgi:hypothetical protein